MEESVKRFAKGFTKTLAIVNPKPERPSAHGPRRPPEPIAKFNNLEAFLSQELNVQYEDLSDGAVSSNADILFLTAPNDVTEEDLFAIDQFLMQGGTVIAASSPFIGKFTRQSIDLKDNYSGVNAWLNHHGLSVKDEIVLDTQNGVFPMQMMRNVGGVQVQDIKMLEYPYFIDVRGEGLNQNNLITSQIPQVTLAWASPVVVDETKNQGREIIELLRSSEESWVSKSKDVLPDPNDNLGEKFKPESEQKSRLLGVIAQGRFESYFAGKDSPLLENDQAESDTENGSSDEQNEAQKFKLGKVVEHSTESARIILIGSNDFLRDEVLQMAGAATQSQYLNSLQFIANAVDWSLGDSGLLGIRSRGHFNRTLPPMAQSEQMYWEYFNYILAALALVAVAVFERRRRHRKQKHYLSLMAD